ncbi:MAG: tungsten cofactor oxidoreductase radical SAM maturase [Negativicutes bacterium]|nr:tungsten cofactor oxidoreductase radical SAM maturase [Negativicutes bacterium]
MYYHRIHTGEEIILLPVVADIRKVYIEASSRCNFSCITCIRHSWEDSQGHMSWNTFVKFLNDARELPNLSTIHFGGFGEPFTNPDILNMIQASKQAGYQVEMITNGSFLSAKTSEQLVNAGLDWLYVSLDGSDAASFEQIRPGSSFERITANINELQRIKRQKGTMLPRLGVEFVVARANHTKLSGMRQIIRALQVDQLLITNVLPYHSSIKDEILYGGATETADLSLLTMTTPLKAAPNMKLYTERACKFINDKAATITWRGEVSPCYAFMHSYTCYILGREKKMQAHSFGNILEKSVKEIWTDEAYVSFRWAVRNNRFPSCIDCRQADGCVMAQTNEGDCWGNQPSCGDCLWARNIIVCP